MKNTAFGFFLGLILASTAVAQTSTVTSVSVVATDAVATEPAEVMNFLDTGIFTITRQGPTNMSLAVFFTLGGIASNGVDYFEVTSPVTIPEGQRTARVQIAPKHDELVEGEERVILRLEPSPLAGPGSGYTIWASNSASASVVIRDPGTNAPPSNAPPAVRISSPSEGANFPAGADIGIAAETVDPDGWVPKVEFFANNAKIGESIINFIVAPPDGTPVAHEFKWLAVAPGNYTLTARGTDDQGRMASSLPVRISVGEGTNRPPMTIVSIVATDPEGREIPEVPPGMGMPQMIDPAIFRVTRTGVLSNALTVNYLIGGTASNGVDYVEISRQVQIPAGASSADIEIDVIDDLLVEGTESVRIQLIPPPCIAIFPPPPECYTVGAPGVAEARILDNDLVLSNRPPVVSIVVPTNGAVFKAPADIQLIASAFDTDGYVATVEFFAGTNSLGITTNNPLAANALNPFQLKWSNVPSEHYMLTALATDDKGAQSRSRPVFISVIGETNRQTVVNIRTIDPEAAEQSPLLDIVQNNALLKVTRSGATDFDLPVYYRVEGTADNGVDYVRLSGSVVIPKGAESADIVIEAIDDKLVERTESILVTVVPPICPAIFPPPPECYLVGSADRATAFILDDEPFETNAPPHVELTQPSSGATFRAPADIHIVARTVDRDGYVGKVEFFANNHKIGEASKEFFVAPTNGTPIEYEIDWNGVAPGQYALTARAIDNRGASGFSAPVRISVTGTNEPPPTNVAVVTVYAIDGYASEGGIVTATNSTRPNTNVAVFEIRRSGGSTDTALRVFYEMHGTASEGVDYLDLPEVAEIPAGQRAARVVVVPIDDQLAENLESVVICLRPSPSATILPTYVVGQPSQAAAVIADNDTPAVRCISLSDGVFHLCQSASDGQCFRIECSSDLAVWTALATIASLDGAVRYVDAEGPAYERRFYRAIPVPCPTEQP